MKVLGAEQETGRRLALVLLMCRILDVRGLAARSIEDYLG